MERLIHPRANSCSYRRRATIAGCTVIVRVCARRSSANSTSLISSAASPNGPESSVATSSDRPSRGHGTHHRVSAEASRTDRRHVEFPVCRHDRRSRLQWFLRDVASGWDVCLHLFSDREPSRNRRSDETERGRLRGWWQDPRTGFPRSVYRRDQPIAISACSMNEPQQLKRGAGREASPLALHSSQK